MCYYNSFSLIYKLRGISNYVTDKSQIIENALGKKPPNPDEKKKEK